jgi:hypothetical protein
VTKRDSSLLAARDSEGGGVNGGTGSEPVGGGQEGDQTTYVCKVALAAGDTVVGKIVPSAGVCKISWSGTEYSYGSYMALQAELRENGTRRNSSAARC